MNQIELDQCYDAMVALWPHYKPVPATFALGERLLGPMDAQAVAAAIEQFSLEGREFAPPLGLVARRAHELLAGVNGTAVPDGHQAIAEVYEWIRKVGVYGTPEWSHPAIPATIEALGGWEATCGDDNPEAWRAHFLRLYEIVRARTEREALVAPSLRELREARAERPALPAPEREAVEVYVPPAGRVLENRAELLAELRRDERSDAGPQSFGALVKRVSVTAHDFGDHQFCPPSCTESATSEPEPQGATHG